MKSGPSGKVIAAGMIGNELERYFAIYGYLASSWLASFDVFALGYLVRPIAGALIGHIGDYYGRRSDGLGQRHGGADLPDGPRFRWSLERLFARTKSTRASRSV
jgi:hypothetical protein